jgi:hypothetical protein
MRLGTLSIITSSLLAMASVALAARQPVEAPLPPEPTEPLPHEAPTPARGGTVERVPMNGSATPAWQAPPGGYGGGCGGYGGWYGVWGDGCSGGCGGGCCDSCSSCCCRPGLLVRIKMLKCKLCAALACRRACRSCCSSSCSSCSSCSGGSSCCGSEYLGSEAPSPPAPSNLLPAPPRDSVPYDRADGEEMDDDASYRPTTAAVPVVRRQYSMPQAKPARKTAKAKNKASSRD